jgi:hypothetical protein
VFSFVGAIFHWSTRLAKQLHIINFKQNAMKEVTFVKATERALIGALATIEVTEDFYYGPKAFHPDMVALVTTVCEMMLKQFKK